MKRKQFIAYLNQNGCTLIREGGRHSLFLNEKNGFVSAIPRHPDLNDITCMKICKQLDVPYPGKN